MGNITYDFCPKCGALVRNGVCSSCGTDYNPSKEPELYKFEEPVVSIEQPEVPDYQNDNNYHNNHNLGGNYTGGNGQPYNYYGGQIPTGDYNPAEKKKTNKILIGVIATVVLVVILFAK